MASNCAFAASLANLTSMAEAADTPTAAGLMLSTGGEDLPEWDSSSPSSSSLSSSSSSSASELMTSGGGELEGVERFVVRSSGVSGFGGLKINHPIKILTSYVLINRFKMLLLLGNVINMGTNLIVFRMRTWMG